MATKGWSFGALTDALKSAAFLDVGVVSGTVAAGNDSRIVNALQKGNNLSDLTNYAAARNQLSAAYVGGDSNVDFYCHDNGYGTGAVNNQRLDFRLGSKADLNGSQYTPFGVGGASAAYHAVRLDQFQSGVNGNGAWVKLPGGSMYCRQNLTVPANSTSTWTFPAAFPDAPAVFFSPLNGENRAWFSNVWGSGCAIYNPQASALNINVLAMW